MRPRPGMQMVPLLILAAGLPVEGVAQSQDTSAPTPISIQIVEPPPPPADTILIHRVLPGAPLLLELTKRSRRLSSDTLFVYSALEAAAWPYSGEPLGTAFEPLFRAFYPTLAFPHREPELFAAGRLVLDPQHIGYLLRVPGMYESSQIDLWIYDAREKRFGLPIHVAEAYGDEGCGFNLESVLIRTPVDRQFNLIVRQNTGCSDMETGKVISNVDSLWVRAWVTDKFGSPVISSDSTLIKLMERRTQPGTQ